MFIRLVNFFNFIVCTQIGNWSRWLSDLFGIDDSDSREESNENDHPKFESSFKPFNLLHALSDLMMLPFEMLADRSMRKEVGSTSYFLTCVVIFFLVQSNSEFLYVKTSEGMPYIWRTVDKKGCQQLCP